MKTNISKKELKQHLETLRDQAEELGFMVGNSELNYMTDEFIDEYADLQKRLDWLLEKVDTL